MEEITEESRLEYNIKAVKSMVFFFLGGGEGGGGCMRMGLG